jgi:hypothetical protein
MTTNKGLKAVTRWFLYHGGLAQFARVKEELARPVRVGEWEELEDLSHTRDSG